MNEYGEKQKGTVLPVEWTTEAIKDIADTTSGGTPSRKKKEYYNGHIPWVKSGELNDSYICETEENISEKALNNSSAKLFPSGTLLIAMYGATAGKTSILNINAATNQAVCAVFPKNGLADTHYLRYYFIYSRPTLLRQRYGGAQPNVSQTIIRNFEVPLPPLPEQRNIAHILSKIQSAIETQEKIIKTTTELKKALMRKLFTEGLHNEPQKETEIGLVPKSWEVKQLKDIALIERGKFAHRPRNDPKFYGGKTPFIQTGDITSSNGRIKLHTQTLNERGLSVSRIFPKGTIVITIAANIGDTAILEFDCAFPDSIIGITPYPPVLATYLEYYLRTQKESMNRMAPRGTQKNINIQFLAPWLIPIPTPKEQKVISDILHNLDESIEISTNRISLLKSLFKSMLHQLMTGQIRVN